MLRIVSPVGESAPYKPVNLRDALRDSGFLGSLRVVTTRGAAAAPAPESDPRKGKGSRAASSDAVLRPNDRKVFRAITHILLSRTRAGFKRLSNPQDISIKEILEVLCLTVQTNNYRSVKRALHRLLTVPFRHYRSAPSRGANDPPLLDLHWSGRRDPNSGRLYRRTQLFLSENYLEALNSSWFRPLDWEVWLALGSSPLAQRLYEVLHDCALEGERGFRFSIGHQELCRVLGIRVAQSQAADMTLVDRANAILSDVRVERGGRVERVRLIDHVKWTWDGREARLHYTLASHPAGSRAMPPLPSR